MIIRVDNGDLIRVIGKGCAVMNTSVLSNTVGPLLSRLQPDPIRCQK